MKIKFVLGLYVEKCLLLPKLLSNPRVHNACCAAAFVYA